MNKLLSLLLATAITLLAPALSWADVILTFGDNPQPGEENVLLNSGATGSTITGTLNQSGLLVNFTSGLQTLTAPASGQARVEATDNGSQVSLADVSFGLANGATFTDAIFNMDITGTIGTAGGPAFVSAMTNDGTFSFQTTLGNGENFLTLTTTGGETLNSVSIFYLLGFTDLRQVRISGATASTVPDSGATLTLLGVGLLGLALVRHKLAPV